MSDDNAGDQLTFFAKLSNWTAFLGGLAGLIAAVSGGIAGVTYVSDRDPSDVAATIQHQETVAKISQYAKKESSGVEKPPSSRTITGPTGFQGAFEGWVYLGQFEGEPWNIEVSGKSGKVKPVAGDEIVLKRDLNLRSHKPRFPSYTLADKVYPDVLSKGTKAKIIKVDHKVGWGNYSWALVQNTRKAESR